MSGRVAALLLLIVVGPSCGADKGDGALEMSEDCEEYLDCMEEVDPEDSALYEATYGEEGSCWASEAEALACTQLCQVNREAEEIEDPTNDACWHDGSPDAQLVLEDGEGWTWMAEAGTDCYDEVYGFSAKLRVSDSGPSFELEIQSSTTWFTPGATTSCELSGLDFACETLDGGDTPDLDLAGSFEEDFRSSTMSFTAEREDGQSFDCAMEGVPYDR